MSALNVGVIGCGDIAVKSYFYNIARRFANLNLYAVSDLVTERARQAAESFGVSKILTSEQMFADDGVDIVLNLTNPQYHYDINMRALLAGKHVYTEKPLALTLGQALETVALAKEKGLYLGCAPDTILGAGAQACRAALTSGAIGRVYAARGLRLYHGPEYFHPRPDFLYKKGVGPMMDIGPYSITMLLYLMGSPVTELFCRAGRAEGARAFNGREIKPEVNTHYDCLIGLENGGSISFGLSWDAWMPNTGAAVQIFGTEGTLFLPDPNGFSPEAFIIRADDLKDADGVISSEKMPRMADYKKKLAPAHSIEGELRGIGLSEMADAIITGRATNQCAGEFACHVTEALLGCDISAETGANYSMTTRVEAPKPLDTDFFTRCREG